MKRLADHSGRVCHAYHSWTMILLFLLALCCATTAADIIYVDPNGSADFTTIQAGIDAATDGDTVIVTDGTYNENISFGGKDIILTSMEPDDWAVVSRTIIDGGGLDSVVTFDGTETSDCKLLGFTITNGYGPTDGSGGAVTGSTTAILTSATIANCIIRDNVAKKHGGGIRGHNGLIEKCIITGNSTVERNGGGMAGCHGLITNCLIYDNTAAGYGGGIMNSLADIVNCTIAYNTALGGSGFSNCDGNISNCIIWGNDIPFPLPHEGFAGPKLTYCCVENWGYGGLGNITIDPEFVDAAGSDYHLLPDSPCIDAGTNDPQGIPSLPPIGLDGNVRPLDGDYDGLAVADMGAYEALASEEPVIGVLPREVEFVVYEGEARPADKILGIRNIGPGTISWEIVEDCGWLEVNPTVGSSAGQINEVTLSVDTTGLVAGEYSCELTITAAGAVNSPRVIWVNLRVVDPLRVPTEYGTIQEAINAATDGDVVLVADGTYTGEGNHNISIWNKAITLRSENGPENCIIDCDGTEDFRGGLNIFSDQGSVSLVDGFTITNASNSAIMCGGDLYYGWGSSPRISNCIITGNTASQSRGVIICSGSSSPLITKCSIINNLVIAEWSNMGRGVILCDENADVTITDCVIQDNIVISDYEAGSSGAICSWGATVTVRNCLIANNASIGGLYNGRGGISCLYSDVTIANSTIVGNSANGNGGGVLCYSSDVKITNSILWDNRASNGPELAIDSGGWWLFDDYDYSSVLTVSHSDVRGGEDAVVYFIRGEPSPFPPGPGTLEWGQGNIDIDPMFVDAGGSDHHLQLGSVCVDAGTNSPAGGLAVVDLDGNSRVIDGDSDGTAVVDMGAYESFAPEAPYIAVIPNEIIFHVFENGPNPAEQVLQIRNIGPDSFNWEILEDCEWLEVSPTSGWIVTETEEVALQVDKTGLGVGCYSCQLSVLSEQAANSPHMVEVKLYVYVDGSIRVPAKHATIQGAIDAAAHGKTIMVAPGTYYENINFKGKDIILTSMEPDDWAVVEATVIDGRGLDSVLRFDGTETSDCKLLGFTITNGYGPTDGDGGGITGGTALYLTDATIANCIIRDNVAKKHGGGIRGNNGLIDRCIITGNSTVEKNGGGMAGCHGRIVNCLVYDNWAAGYGGGMVQCDGDIISCTIVDNTALEGGGVSHCDGAISNCIIWGNDFEQFAYGSDPTYSCIEDWLYGGRGNINTEPGFVNAAGGDYHLRYDSPCVDAGTNGPVAESFPPDTDIEGNVRPLDGDYDGTAAVDMGAYELLPPAGPYILANQREFNFHISENGPTWDEQILEIRNPGTDSFNWEILEDCEWLEVWPISGEIGDEVDEVTLRVDTAGLESGGHICELAILSRQAVNPGAPGLTVFVILNICSDDDIIVPVDYATIQSAIDAAADGDTVIAGTGTYNENINFGGKNIILRSVKPEDKAVVARTIIQGDGTNSVVIFAGSEDPNCVLLGFTITGGNTRYGGAGIAGCRTRATIANCVIKSNTAERAGGGIKNVDGRIDKCVIFGNRAYSGGGIAGSHARIANCLVYGNRANHSGGGMIGCNGDIVNCTIADNTALEVGGLGLCDGSITNCIIWGNALNQLAGSVWPTYSCFPGAHFEYGNIRLAPVFVDAAEADYRLKPNSPCVDRGTNSPPSWLPATDIDGNIRPIDGNYDGSAVVDMGAYELSELVGIEIAGPGEVAENSSMNYRLIARHEGGSSGETAGGVVNWWVEPAIYASIDDNGMLQTEDVDTRREVTVYTEYVREEVKMEAEKVVSILPVCPEGSVLQFDGEDDYVEIAGYKGVAGGRSRTVSAWIKTDTVGREIISWGSRRGDQVPSDEEAGGGRGWIFRLNGAGGIRVEVGPGSVNGTTDVADGQWHHVAAVLESDGTPDVSDVKLYVDGIEEYTVGVSHEINTARDPDVRIGVFTIEGLWPQPWWEHPEIIWPPDDSGRYFEGAIDEVRIWNVARTREEIQVSMHQRLEGNEPGLVGYWNFDEGQGQIVYDLSPKGNNGYLRCGPAWVDSDAPIGFCNRA